MIDERDLPAALAEEFRAATKTLSNARRAEAWDTLFKCVRWALASQDALTSGLPVGYQRQAPQP